MVSHIAWNTSATEFLPIRKGQTSHYKENSKLWIMIPQVRSKVGILASSKLEKKNVQQNLLSQDIPSAGDQDVNAVNIRCAPHDSHSILSMSMFTQPLRAQASELAACKT